ncbi:MAG: hypothetical protein R2712_24255 [Vicinamibacterales bacterium]
MLSIRRFRTDRLRARRTTVSRISLTWPMLDFMRAAVGARLNIRVGRHRRRQHVPQRALDFISDRERIVTIEDAAELVCGSGTWCGSRRARPTSKARAR